MCNLVPYTLSWEMTTAAMQMPWTLCGATLQNPQIPLEAPLLPGGHMLAGPQHKMGNKTYGPQDNVEICLT
jgi:hypothetical protein